MAHYFIDMQYHIAVWVKMPGMESFDMIPLLVKKSIFMVQSVQDIWSSFQSNTHYIKMDKTSLTHSPYCTGYTYSIIGILAQPNPFSLVWINRLKSDYS